MAPKRNIPASLVDYDSENGSSEDESTEITPSYGHSVIEEEEDEVESEREIEEANNEDDEEATPTKEVRVPTKRGKKTKSSKYQIGFCVDLAWCKKENWNEFLDVINQQKWSKLLCFCADEGLYEKEMNEFCTNYETHEGLILSVINGKMIKFDVKKLGEWFEVPTEGYKEYCKGRVKLNVNGADNEVILKCFGGSENALSIDQKHLAPLPKLLFQLVWRFILPRPQKRTIANMMDLSLMYCLIKGIPINFPALMISHLTHCVTRKLRVGYGNLLTYIFKKCNVKFPDEPSFELEPENYLTEKTLHGLNMRVVGGKLEYVVEVVKKKEEGNKRKRKTEVEEENQEELGTQKNKVAEDVPEKPSREPRTRKSQRIATKFVSTEANKEAIDLDADEEQVPPPSQKHDAPPAPVYGFSRFAAGSSGDVLQEIKGLLTDLMTTVDALSLKVDGLETKLHDMKFELFHQIRMSGAAVESMLECVAATFRPPQH